jgi:hypothetical protein
MTLPGAGEKIAVSEELKTTGAPLAGYRADDSDPAEGVQAPSLSASDFNGDPVHIIPGNSAKVIVFVNHWSPHSQALVTKLVAWHRTSGLPRGVEMYAVVTGSDESKANYPPYSWLKDEQWPSRVLLDDKDNRAARAYGMANSPFVVFVDEHGAVVRRFSGAIPIDEFADEVAELA